MFAKLPSYENKRKRLVIAFVASAFLFVMGIIAIYTTLPTFSPNSDIVYLQNAHSAIGDIDSYVESQLVGARIDQDVLQDKINDVVENLSKVTDENIYSMIEEWNIFSTRLMHQNHSLVVLSDVIRLELVAQSASDTLYQLLTALSSQLSDSRSVSVETIRAIDILANNVIKLQSSIYQIIHSHYKVDIQSIALLTDSLNSVQKGLNTLVVGSPMDGVQSVMGSLEEEQVVEARFVFLQLARTTTTIIKDARNIIFLNKTKIDLEKERDNLQNQIQTSIDRAYQYQENYINRSNYSVLIVSLTASIGVILFFLIFAFLFLRLDRSRQKALFEKDNKIEAIDKIMSVFNRVIDQKKRLQAPLDMLNSLYSDGSSILNKGKEIREVLKELSVIIKEMENSYQYMNQSLTHNLTLAKKLKNNSGEISLQEIVSKQLKFFSKQQDDFLQTKKSLISIEEFFSNVVSNTSESIVAYQEVEREITLIISEIDQLNEGLKY